MLHHIDGFDEETVIEELDEVDFEDNQLLDCVEGRLDEFPYGENADGESADPKDDAKRKRFILDLIVKLNENPNRSFSGINVIPASMSNLMQSPWILSMK